MTIRSIGAAVLLACFATTIAGAGQPSFRSKIEAVEVDVAVTRGGRTVAGLTADNFVVTDNGVVQDVKATLLAAEPLRQLIGAEVQHGGAAVRAGLGRVTGLELVDEVPHLLRRECLACAHGSVAGERRGDAAPRVGR